MRQGLKDRLTSILTDAWKYPLEDRIAVLMWLEGWTEENAHEFFFRHLVKTMPEPVLNTVYNRLRDIRIGILKPNAVLITLAKNLK